MSLLAVTVIGHDRPGIIAQTTAVLADLEGNLEDSTMTILRGHFAMVLLVSTGASAAQVEAGLAVLTADGTLQVSVREVPEEPGDGAPHGASYLLSVHGADRPGIESAMTATVAGAVVGQDDAEGQRVGQRRDVGAGSGRDPHGPRPADRQPVLGDRPEHPPPPECVHFRPHAGGAGGGYVKEALHRLDERRGPPFAPLRTGPDRRRSVRRRFDVHVDRHRRHARRRDPPLPVLECVAGPDVNGHTTVSSASINPSVV